MRKTLVSKLKKSGQLHNVICEITGHSQDTSLENYDQIDENRRKNLSHIITGYQGKGSKCKDSKVSASDFARCHHGWCRANIFANLKSLGRWKWNL
jgi:hypothetical protein